MSSAVRGRGPGLTNAAQVAERGWVRAAGLTFGIGTQLLFLWTVVQLFLFLRFGSARHYPGGLILDASLAIGFAIPHSLLLMPAVQNWLRTWFPSGLIGCLYCCVTCVSLLLLFHFWSKNDGVIWQLGGWKETVCLVGFYGSWMSLFYSLYWTGFGYQTGLTPWWYWARRQKQPRRPLITQGPYRWMRHPVYMSFLGLIWFSPMMTLDHALLTTLWTGYIFAGSHFKDRRLVYYLGEEYVRYGQRVVGLPFIGVGSLRYLGPRQELGVFRN